MLPYGLLSQRPALPPQDNLRGAEGVRLRRPVHQQSHSGGGLYRIVGPNEPLHLPSEIQSGLPGHQCKAHDHPGGRLRCIYLLHQLCGSQGPVLCLQLFHHDVRQCVLCRFTSIPSPRRCCGYNNDMLRFAFSHFVPLSIGFECCEM